jgi:hypothetical protein
MKKTQVALVAVGLLALAGGGTALANKGRGTTHTTNNPARAHDMHGPGDDLAAAASYLGATPASLMTQLQAGKTLAAIAGATTGKSVAGLVSALVASEKTELAAAVTAGKLTQAQADTITSTLQQRFTDFVYDVRPAGGPPAGGHFDHGPGPGLDAAATYLGISQTSLFTQLRTGKTLAQIADATTGKSATGLIAALVADAKQHFGSNVPSDLTQRITDLVNGVRPAGGPPGGPGHGFFHRLRSHA